MWWLSLGILLQLLYGLTMATHHMMFSFRYFVPYLPSVAFLVVESLRRVFLVYNQVNLHSGRNAIVFRGFLLCLLTLQGTQIVYTYYCSLNGMSSVGEYQKLSVRGSQKFMETLRQESETIRAHWQGTEECQRRHPRIHTYAAGLLPYMLRDAYIYSSLISYRHNYDQRQTWRYLELVPSADYIHVFAPKNETVEQWLPEPISDYSLISSYEWSFCGAMVRFLVYHNANPKPHTLRATISESRQ